MKKKGKTLLIAYWLIVRLQTAVLATRSVLHQLFTQPRVIYISRQSNQLPFGGWVYERERMHCVASNPSDDEIRICSLDQLEKN